MIASSFQSLVTMPVIAGELTHRGNAHMAPFGAGAAFIRAKRRRRSHRQVCPRSCDAQGRVRAAIVHILQDENPAAALGIVYIRLKRTRPEIEEMPPRRGRIRIRQSRERITRGPRNCGPSRREE